jgi:hypothetical protein
MSILRSFTACREAMLAHRPEAKPKKTTKSKKAPREFTKQDPVHYASTEAWAWDDLSAWPKSPPINSIHLLPKLDGAEGLDDPEAFMARANFGNAVGTWNTRDEEASWACEPGQWLIIRAELVREEDEGDGVALAFACWKVEEGFAVAIVDYGKAPAWLPSIMGLDAWPAQGSWKEASVWYGE